MCRNPTPDFVVVVVVVVAAACLQSAGVVLSEIFGVGMNAAHNQ
jgi:hypothetical protein